MTDSSTEKILIVGPSWVGDMVMAQSLFKVLKQRYEKCEIVVMAPTWARPIVDRMPEVSESFPADFDHGELGLGKRRQLGKSLRSQGFTQAIVLPNSFKSALVPFHAKIPFRTGWRGEWRVPLLNDCRVLNKAELPLMVQRFAALGSPKGESNCSTTPNPELVVKKEQQQESLKKFGLNTNTPIVALCPGAEFGAAKQWPADYFKELAERLLNQGKQVWIFGSENDTEFANTIECGLSDEGPLFNLTGRTSLAEVIDLMALANVCVTNDSGLMHIAAALGVPVTALYGSTSPEFTPPLTEKAQLLMTEIECRPCFQRQCPLGHLRCLKEITPQRVYDSVAALN